ncbi:hypothetical protein [Proteus mirabilis]|uniref:hypothetical protein n=1 Tax=Proteus mirabilis TaxID=584 RepID=UPI002362A9D6|nr:hypothetical protein [Proteus mirabilis]MDC9787891.1 hypothetical protein [Proteus mirabilis]
MKNLIFPVLSAISGLISAGFWHLSAHFPDQNVSIIENEYAAIFAIISASLVYLSLIIVSKKNSSIEDKKEELKEEISKKLKEELSQELKEEISKKLKEELSQEQEKEKEEKEKEKEKIL